MRSEVSATDIYVYKAVLSYLLNMLFDYYDRATSTDKLFEEPKFSKYFNTIVKRVYTKSMGYVEKRLRETLKNLVGITQKHQRKVVYNVKWLLLRLVEEGETEGVRKRLGKYPKTPSPPPWWRIA